MSYEHEYLHDVDIANESKATAYSGYFENRPMDITSAHELVDEGDNLALTAQRLNDAINVIAELQSFKTDSEMNMLTCLTLMGSAAIEYDHTAAYNRGDIVSTDGGNYHYLCVVDGTTGLDPDVNESNWVNITPLLLGLDVQTDLTMESHVGGDLYKQGDYPVARVNNSLMSDDAYSDILDDSIYYHLEGDELTFKYKDADGEVFDFYPENLATNVIISSGEFAGRTLPDVLNDLYRRS